MRKLIFFAFTVNFLVEHIAYIMYLFSLVKSIVPKSFFIMRNPVLLLYLYKFRMKSDCLLMLLLSNNLLLF